MKKKNISGLFILLGCMCMFFVANASFLEAMPAQEGQGNFRAKKQEDQNEIVLRTYHLKFINPVEILNAAKFYVVDSTSSRNTITIRIRKNNIPKFEELLKKLDVEKKSVLFKIYTVIASREELKQAEAIENKDLRRVLDELESLWKFKSYRLDGPSFLTVKDGSGLNYFKLVSTTYDFNLRILHVSLIGEQNERIVSVGQIQLRQLIDVRDDAERTLINTENVTLKEKGYLVAGVSGIGTDGKALILIIGAEIQ